MKLATVFTFASALTLLLAPCGTAADPLDANGPLYDVSVITFTLRNDKHLREELNLTEEQVRALLDPAENGKFMLTREESARVTGPGKVGERNALLRKKAEEYFSWAEKRISPGQIKRLKQIWLQQKGVKLFDYREIRDVLKLDEAQVKQLWAAHRKLREHYEAEFRAGRINQTQAREISLGLLRHGVPEQVRELLSPEQRKKLNEMLGEPYDLSKK